MKRGLHLAAACVVFFGAVARAEAPQQSLKEERPSTGSIIRRDVAWSTTSPINKTYAQLTEEQKQKIHAQYESIAPGDEPPFPKEGPKPIVVAIHKAQEMLLARGKLRFIVTVGPDGKAKKVDAFGDCDKAEMTRFAGQVLLLTKYKPAICKGAPCAMEFPFNLSLSVKN